MGPTDSTPPAIFSAKWAKSEIDKLWEKKADKAVVKSELRAVRNSVSEARRVADEARSGAMKPHPCTQQVEIQEARSKAMEAASRSSHPHVCTQKDVIDKMDRDLFGWTKWFRRGIGAFLAFILVYGVIIVWQWVSLSSSVEATDKTVNEMKKDVASIREKQGEIATAVVGKQADDEREAQLAAIKKVVEDALEVKAVGKKKKR